MNEQNYAVTEKVELSKIDKQDRINIEIKNNESESQTKEKIVDNLEIKKPTTLLREKNKRCSLEGCNKKLRLTDMACRCGKKFCGNHRVWSDHNCTYDYKSSERKELEKNNEKIVGEKLNKM